MLELALTAKQTMCGTSAKAASKIRKWLLERPVAVKIKGGPYLLGDRLDRNLFAEEMVILDN